VITTAPGAKRLGGGATGLEDWQSARLEVPGRPAIDVTGDAVPCSKHFRQGRTDVGRAFAAAPPALAGALEWLPIGPPHVIRR